MADTGDELDLMTVDELADVLKLKKHTLLNWRATGQWPEGLPAGFRIGRTVYFRRSAVVEHVARLAQEAG